MMISGSKALSLAVLGALFLSDEACAASKVKDNHNNKGLRKALEVESINNMAGGDSVGPDAVVPDTCGDVGIEFGTPECKHQYSLTANTRPCETALECTNRNDITMLTLKYTSVPFTYPNCTIDDNIYCPFQDKAEGGRVLVVENTDMFQMKLMNVHDLTYDNLKWYIDYDLKNAMPMGKIIFNYTVAVGGEIPLKNFDRSSTYNELAYFAFDEDGNLITFAILDLDCGAKTYNIGDMLGNSMITSFQSSTFGTVTSTVFIDSYEYSVLNNCNGTEPAGVYSLDRTFCTSSCGEDKWDCPEAAGYNPFSCVADGKTQLGCSGSPTVEPLGSTTFTDSIDGLAPIDLFETKFRLNVNAMIKYSEFWTVESTPEGGVTSLDFDKCLN